MDSAPPNSKAKRTPSASPWGRAFDRLLDATAAISCALLLFQVVSVCADVLLRDFAALSFNWLTALNEWSLVFVAFVGAAWLQREGGHTKDDSMLVLLGHWGPPISEWLGLGLGILVCVFLVWYGTEVTWNKYATDVYDFFKLPDVPVFWVYAIIPIGSVLWLIQIIREAVARRRRPRGD